MKCQSYSFFRGSDYLRIEAISHFCQASRLTKQHYTTTREVVSSLLGRWARNDSWWEVGLLLNLQQLTTSFSRKLVQVSQRSAFSGPAAWGTDRAGLVVRVVRPAVRPVCSGGPGTPGLASLWSDRTWWGSSWGWPDACAPWLCAFWRCCCEWMSGDSKDRGPGCPGVVVWCERGGSFRIHRFSHRKGISVWCLSQKKAHNCRMDPAPKWQFWPGHLPGYQGGLVEEHWTHPGSKKPLETVGTSQASGSWLSLSRVWTQPWPPAVSVTFRTSPS